MPGYAHIPRGASLFGTLIDGYTFLLAHAPARADLEGNTYRGVSPAAQPPRYSAATRSRAWLIVQKICDNRPSYLIKAGRFRSEAMKESARDIIFSPRTAKKGRDQKPRPFLYIINV